MSLASSLEASRCWWPWRLSLWIYGGESKGARTPNFSCFFIWRCGVDGDEKLNAAAPPRRSTCPLPPVFFFFPFFKQLIFCTLLFNTHWIFLLRSLSVSATGVNACGSFSDFELRSVLYAGAKHCSETCRFRICPSCFFGRNLSGRDLGVCLLNWHVHSVCSQLVFVGLGAVCSALRRWASALHHRAGERQCLHRADDWAAAGSETWCNVPPLLSCRAAEKSRTEPSSV